MGTDGCGYKHIEGFLAAGRGVDDSLMVSRRLSEEVNRSVGDEWVLMSFLDIEKA